MESKHTPGPWRWIGDNALWSEKDGEVIESGDDGKPYGMHSGEIHHHYNAETKEANKALIAAAPDLLATLVAIDERLTECAAIPASAADAYDSDFQELVRDAIAKATGEATC